MKSCRRRDVVAGCIIGGLSPLAAQAALPRFTGEQPRITPRFTAQSQGLEIEIRRRDERGARLVLIHGLAHSHLTWIDAMNSIPNEVPVAAMDLRGHGGSTKPLDIGSYLAGRSWADDIHAVLQAFGGKRPILVGWSLGGLAVTHYLDAYGDEAIGGVVLVGAVSVGDPSLFAPATAKILARLSRPGLEERVDAVDDFIDLSFETRPQGRTRDRILAAGSVVPEALFEAVGRLEPAPPSALRRVRVPTLLIHGTRDRLVHPEMSRRAASLVPGSELRLYAASGHGPLLDEPVRLGTDLARFAGRAA